MNFSEIAENRQSCRKYDRERRVEAEKLDSILASARLAPSACNGQPYHITVCRGESARAAAKACQGMGMNGFASDADIIILISEEPYVKSAAIGARLKNNDYRSMDIGILAAYITAEAAAQALGSCILGWFDNGKLKKLFGIEGDIRLAITVGYPAKEDTLRKKVRKDISELVSFKD